MAARLTGWRVDIRSESEFAAEEAEHGYEEEEVQGRCAAILSNGRRCPNASLPGSRYCGLESHQALANIEGDQVADLTPGGEGATEAEQPPAAVPVVQEDTTQAETTVDAPASDADPTTPEQAETTVDAPASDEDSAMPEEQSPSAQATAEEQTP